MGISDKDMADAIALSLLNKTVGTTTIANERYAYGWNDPTVGAMVAPPPTKNWDVISQDDLKNEAMQVPLSTLIDMWTIRFQGKWVNEEMFINDNFWRLIALRLVGANKLEKHRLVDSYNPVYRIIE
jgi:hypothetical protein